MRGTMVRGVAVGDGYTISIRTSKQAVKGLLGNYKVIQMSKEHDRGKGPGRPQGERPYHTTRAHWEQVRIMVGAFPLRAPLLSTTDLSYAYEACPYHAFTNH